MNDGGWLGNRSRRGQNPHQGDSLGREWRLRGPPFATESPTERRRLHHAGYSGIEHWLEGVLTEFAALGPVQTIVPVAHGAGVALIHQGRLQCAPLDYEWSGVARDRAGYDKQRDAFAVTGSPALPAGLNLGAQIHWPRIIAYQPISDGTDLAWAQYWAWVLSGAAATEVTSLGCHTDLWRPYHRAPSELAIRRGWAERLAPLTPANTVLGQITPEWAKRTGLSRHVNVHCGLHDSNAALLAARSQPTVTGRETTVLSTGTWFVAMRCPLPAEALHIPMLPESRDCLVNVDVDGLPVPSSRFMGGRELEILAGAELKHMDANTDTSQVRSAMRAIEAGEMILPSAVPGVGPFPEAPQTAPRSIKDVSSAALLYAALVADVSLDLIGSRDMVLIDGRFSRATVFVQALARLRPNATILVSKDENGVAQGALRLVNRHSADAAPLERVAPLPIDMSDYRAQWRDAVEHMA